MPKFEGKDGSNIVNRSEKLKKKLTQKKNSAKAIPFPARSRLSLFSDDALENMRNLPSILCLSDKFKI